MKKYYKFWSILALILLVIISLVYSRPRKVNDIIMTSPDKVFLEVTNWTRATPRHENIEMKKEEFNKVVEMMSINEYRKSAERKIHRSDSGSYYFITFKCYVGKSNEYQTITLTKGGFVQINDCWYDVSGGVDIGKEMINNIYEYICEILEEI